MKEKIDRDILARYVNGEFTSDDEKYMEGVFCDDNYELQEILKSDWLEINKNDNLEERELDHILHTLYYKINHQEKKKRTGRLVSLWKTYSRAAAVLLFPLVLAYAIYNQVEIKQIDTEISYAEINAPLGSRVKFSLPDGSSGWLNSASTLKYPIRFTDSRNVELSGEAFFDIKKNISKPFNVKASGLNISVLGTKFNVTAYKDDTNVDIVLVSGKVRLNHLGSKKFIYMEPNERVIYKKSDKKVLSKTKVNSRKYSSWIEGKLIFRNDPIDEVARRLERWYKVDIVVNKVANANFRLRATFEDEEIEEVMRLLKLTFPIDYKFEKRRMDADGKFEKKKIIINVK